MNEKVVFAPAEIEYYVGNLSYESFLFSESGQEYCPDKNDFILYNSIIYKVMYVMFDYDNNKLNVFLRETIEEDF